MLILGIETSCDETASAVISADKNDISVLSNVVSSQVKLHAEWGGVVPNLAAREHLKNILPVIEKSLKEVGIKLENIDLIAVTSGPGLIPALLIGVNSAKTLSYTTKKPLIGIHHIEGHIYANFIGADEEIKFPLLCLVVSGGHTELVLMKDHLQYEVVGQTLDDAAGEAFDKVARILSLGYPGGPAIAAAAANYQLPIANYQSISNGKIPKLKNDISFPRPMINSGNYDFSFSGLKTAVLYETKKHPELLKDKNYINAVCYEFQQAVIDVLIAKTLAVAKKYKPKTISLAGGVSANIELREQLEKAVKDNLKNTSYKLPATSYSMDNAAMIASAAYFRIKKNKDIPVDNWKKITADANLELK